MPKKLLLVLLCAVLVVFACGCSDDTDNISSSQPIPDYPVTVANVTLESCPQRVVSLSPSITSVINELGSSAQLAGVCNCSSTDKELPRVGTADLPDITRILNLNPDLILSNTTLPFDIAERLQLEGIPVAVVEAAETLEELDDYYLAIAKLVSGKHTGESNARLTFERFMGKIEKIKQDYPIIQGKKVCLILASGVVATGDSLLGQFLEAAGFSNVAAGGTGYSMSYEDIAKQNPEYIFCPDFLKNEILGDKALGGTAAVAGGKVFAISVTDLEKQGQETYKALEQMAKLISESAA
ncbi:MAG TPA: ABC transporter substrate-binding protein [Clostridiales bacterium]|nr:ABC transporter substrate-binding protein [Clostridiales bacterium]